MCLVKGSSNYNALNGGKPPCRRGRVVVCKANKAGQAAAAAVLATSLVAGVSCPCGREADRSGGLCGRDRGQAADQVPHQPPESGLRSTASSAFHCSDELR